MVKNVKVFLSKASKKMAPHPAQDCRQASMVAKVSGGSCALLGWSLSGARPPIMDGQRLFRNVTHAWIKGS